MSATAPSDATPQRESSEPAREQSGNRDSSGPKASQQSSTGRTSSDRASALALEGSDTTNQSPWAGIFSMSVYYPKFVMINNARLTILYYFLTILLVLGIIWYFLVNSQMNIDKTPFAMVHLCITSGGTQCKLDFASTQTLFTNGMAGADKDVCDNSGHYEYWESSYKKWTPSGCAKVCGTQSSSSTLGTKFQPDYCIFPEETILLSPQMAFVPTYISDTTYLPLDGNGACTYTSITQPNPSGYTKTPDGLSCYRKHEKFVPGVGQQKIQFTHEFAVSPEMAAFVFSKEDKKALSKATKAQPWDNGMKTVFYSYDGRVVKEWAAGEWIDPDVNMLLGASDYEDVGPSGALSLDQVYTRLDYGVPKNTLFGTTNAPTGVKEGVSLRVTGVTVTIDIAITDNGKCHHVKLEEDYDVGDGPVACMFAHAERTWTHEGTQYQVGSDGSYKEIQRSGVRIKFRPKGSVQLFDMTVVTQSFTVAVVWIQIPLVIVYFFTVICLGHLSTVYSRVINQELSLGNACKGLACRLVSHSAAYMDLQDMPDGISKKKLSDRFKHILQTRIKNGELQQDEVDNYVNYVFEGMQSMGDGTQVVINDSINIQEFCQACCTNEPLSFEQLVMLFDKDRKVGCLESFFLDDTIRGVINESQKVLKDADATPDQSAREEAILIDAVLKLKTCSDQVEELEGICQKIVKTASSELDTNIDLSHRAAAIADKRRAEGKSVIDPIHDFTPTEDPKPDQRESNCSVADEEEPGKGYWNEV